MGTIVARVTGIVLAGILREAKAQAKRERLAVRDDLTGWAQALADPRVGVSFDPGGIGVYLWHDPTSTDYVDDEEEEI
jgi:hypothetical protein